MALSATVELNKYLVKKRKAVKDLSEGIYKLLENTGARGFVLGQGELSYNLQEIIAMTKRAASDASLAVLEEQIKLELEITAKEYQLQIEQAKINWDIEKGALINALAVEIAQLELAYDLIEEELNEAALEIERRKAVLTQAKTDLEVAIETLNKELAVLDASTAGYEVLLINARIATNTEKLKVIPYLQELIEKEGELLQILERGMGSETELIEAKRLLIDAKKNIMPFLQEKADFRYRLGTAQYGQAVIDLQRADLLLEKIENDRRKTNSFVAVGQEDIVMSGLQRQLAALRNEVERRRLLNQVTHIHGAVSADQQVSSFRRVERTGVTNSDINSASILRGGDGVAFAAGQNERSSVAGIEVPADVDVILTSAQNSAVAITETAEISSKAEVTSKLVHLLGSV